MLGGWAPLFDDVVLVPSSGGAFEVWLDDDLIFSKKATRRHAADGEIADLLRARLGPEVHGG